MNTQLTSVDTEVTKTFRLSEGKRYRISPSQGFLGIEDGVIQIDAIYSYEDVCKRSEDVQGTLADVEVIVDCDPDTIQELWVVYYYWLKPQEQGYYYALPVGLFTEHISLW